MIAHVSVPAANPRATAVLLARLIDGETFPFPVVEVLTAAEVQRYRAFMNPQACAQMFGTVA